jgi:tetratricopeptide (TPR) repeat protein
MGEKKMRKTTIAVTAAACFVVLLSALFSTCGNPEKGRVPVTTQSKEALKLYREGMVLSDQLQGEKAKALFAKAIQKDSAFAMAYYRLALSSVTYQDFYKSLSKASSLADKITEGERIRIQSLKEFSTGNNQKGADLMLRLTELYPKDREARVGYAGYLTTRHRYDEAAEQYRKAVEADPSYGLGYNDMAYSFMRAGKQEEAEKAIKQYIAIKPSEPNPYDSQGEIFRKAGKFEESTESYRLALAKDSTFSMSQRGIGINLAIEGKTAEAVKELEKAAAIGRNDGEKRSTYYAMGFAWILGGNYTKAADAVRQAMALAEKDNDKLSMSDDFQAIAGIMLEQDQFAKYRENNDRAVRLMEESDSPEDVKSQYRDQFLFMQSDAARKQGLFKLAKAKAEEYQKAVASRKDPYFAWQCQDLIGSLALAEKRYDDAVRELEKADQSNCYILYRLGEAWAAKGDREKAKELFSKVADFNENNWGFAFLKAKARKKLENL